MKESRRVPKNIQQDRNKTMTHSKYFPKIVSLNSKDIFRTPLNIYDGASLQKKLMAKS